MPKTKYTTIINVNISEKVNKFIFITFVTAEATILSVTKLYAIPNNIIEINADITPINIPSTINGHLIKLFVAPTYSL